MNSLTSPPPSTLPVICHAPLALNRVQRAPMDVVLLGQPLAESRVESGGHVWKETGYRQPQDGPQICVSAVRWREALFLMSQKDQERKGGWRGESRVSLSPWNDIWGPQAESLRGSEFSSVKSAVGQNDLCNSSQLFS